MLVKIANSLATLNTLTMLKRFFIAISIFALSSNIGAIEQLIHGNGALEVFDSEGLKASPGWVQVWVYFMMLMFASGLVFVKRHNIARWLVGGFILGILTLIILQKGLGIVPLSGLIALMHLLFWSPGLFKLLKGRPFFNGVSPISIWSGLMTMTILFSFIFDLRDAAIYLHHLFF